MDEFNFIIGSIYGFFGRALIIIPTVIRSDCWKTARERLYSLNSKINLAPFLSSVKITSPYASARDALDVIENKKSETHGWNSPFTRGAICYSPRLGGAVQINS